MLNGMNTTENKNSLKEEMRNSIKSYIGVIISTSLLTIIVTLGIIYFCEAYPKDSIFNIELFGVYLGAILSAILTLVSVILIVASTNKQINNQNERIAEQIDNQNRIQKQNADINLFEKRFELYNQIKDYYSFIFDIDFNSAKYLDTILERMSNKNERYLNNLKVKYLFSDNDYDRIKKLEEILKSIVHEKNRMDKYYDYIITNCDPNGGFKAECSRFFNSNKLDEDLKQFQCACNHFELKNSKLLTLTPEDLNYYNMYGIVQYYIDYYKEILRLLVIGLADKLKIADI